MQLAGVAALTIPPNLLHSLSGAEELETKLAECSIFNAKANVQEQKMERMSFMDDEDKFREAFSKRDGGKGELKTKQVSNPLRQVDVLC